MSGAEEIVVIPSEQTEVNVEVEEVKVEVEDPKVEVVEPKVEIEEIKVEVEEPKVEVEEVKVEEAKFEEINLEEPKVEVEVKEVKVEVEEPKVEVEEPKVEVEVKEVKVEVEVEVEEPKVEVEEPKVEVEEQKVEEPEIKINVEAEIEEVLPDFTDKTLAEVFMYIVKKHIEEKKDTKKYYTKIGIYLSKEVVEIINKIIDKSPTLLSEIESAVSSVIKDNKIDTNDIPDFIVIVKKLYQGLHNLKDIVIEVNKRSETCATILKFIIHTLVEERKIIIEEDKKVEILSQFDRLIDSCISLLNFKDILKPKECCNVM